MVDSEYDYLLRIIIVGDTNVGKSSLMTRFEKNVFYPDDWNLFPSSFMNKYEQFDDCFVRMMIWDGSKARRYNDLPTVGFLDKEIIMLVFDLSSRETFNHVDLWHTKAQKNTQKSTVFVLIGNKNDLPREVSDAEARQKARMMSVTYVETSAKTGENIHTAFRINTEEAIQNIRRNYDKLIKK
ncbi:unnamed protein product [Blepharisma stoltei]|uniref:Uncharacterized protein n=1 Tax=Blepharisma stoltei TaxID=1481888 RepID=A0AAU9IWC3_9CILI|nr:unnamed protein product [Blepharisma stoltei]